MVRGPVGPYGADIHDNGEKKRVRLKSLRCRTAQAEGGKGHAIPNTRPPRLRGRGLREANRLLASGMDTAPFPFGKVLLRVLLIVPTPSNQSFAFMQGGVDLRLGRMFSTIRHFSLVSLLPLRWSLCLSRSLLGCATLRGPILKAPGDRKACSQNESPIGLTGRERVGWCRRSSCSLVP